MNSRLLTQNVVSPLFNKLNKHVELMIIGLIVEDSIIKCF